jgi:PadR family transcriptional regulator AphA
VNIGTRPGIDHDDAGAPFAGRIDILQVSSQDARPSKRIFTITPQGKEIFLKWLHEPTRHVRDLRVEFMTKLFFFSHLPIRGGKQVVDAQIAHLKSLKLKIRQNHSAETDLYKRLVYGFKLSTVDARLKWLTQKAGPFVERIKKEANEKTEKS